MELDDKVCYCFHVSKRKVLNFLRLHKPRVASQISECGGAGTGCGWCVAYLKRYFEANRTGEILPSDEMTPEQYAQQRAAYILAGHGTPPPGATPLPKSDESSSLI
ncbi:MAG: (2Fe-2S)-binding protein [Planctomycetales bacterium]|nr:(2Fe-2S)-binding protein [Planctomycetales bacterium]